MGRGATAAGKRVEGTVLQMPPGTVERQDAGIRRARARTCVPCWACYRGVQEEVGGGKEEEEEEEGVPPPLLPPHGMSHGPPRAPFFRWWVAYARETVRGIVKQQLACFIEQLERD